MVDGRFVLMLLCVDRPKTPFHPDSYLQRDLVDNSDKNDDDDDDNDDDGDGNDFDNDYGDDNDDGLRTKL